MVDLGVVVRNVTILDEGITIEYIMPRQDVHPDGLMFNHAVFLPDTDEYEDVSLGIRRALDTALQRALARATNVTNAPVGARTADVTNEDEIGPYEYAPGEGPGNGSGNGQGSEPQDS